MSMVASSLVESIGIPLVVVLPPFTLLPIRGLQVLPYNLVPNRGMRIRMPTGDSVNIPKHQYTATGLKLPVQLTGPCSPSPSPKFRRPGSQPQSGQSNGFRGLGNSSNEGIYATIYMINFNGYKRRARVSNYQDETEPALSWNRADPCRHDTEPIRRQLVQTIPRPRHEERDIMALDKMLQWSPLHFNDTDDEECLKIY